MNVESEKRRVRRHKLFLPQIHLLSAIPHMPLAIKRVCVMYANFKTQRGVLESGVLRFFGSVDLHESGPVREAIFAKLLPAGFGSSDLLHQGRGQEAVDWRLQPPFEPRVEAGVSQEPKKHQLGNKLFSQCRGFA